MRPSPDRSAVRRLRSLIDALAAMLRDVRTLQGSAALQFSAGIATAGLRESETR